MATAMSSYTQNPLALAGMAWCSPPAGLKACSAAPDRTASAPTRVAPTTRAAASCMCGKTGLSGGPKPYCHRPPPRGARRTVSTYGAVWTSNSSSSVASRAASARTRSPPTIP